MALSLLPNREGGKGWVGVGIIVDVAIVYRRRITRAS